MTKRGRLALVGLTGLIAGPLCGSSSLVGAVSSSPALNVAAAAVYNVNEMSERGPLPLLAIFPDGRVAFPTQEGDYKVVHNRSGVAGLD